MSISSGLHPIADIAWRGWDGSFVPRADSCTAANEICELYGYSITSSARKTKDINSIPSLAVVFNLCDRRFDTRSGRATWHLMKK
jgi:hypothetical protein